MVTITNYFERQRKDGSSFVVLEITGGVELIQSSTTRNFYATVRKCTIPSTFSAEIASKMVGAQLPGSVVKVEVEPYEFVNKRTGEVLQLQHSYSYKPDKGLRLMGESKVLEMA